jgi:surface antigen
MKKSMLPSIKTPLILAFALALTACDNISNQEIGAVTGGALGGVLGNQIGGGTGKVAATIVGVMAGALIGGSIGRTMDKVDAANLNQALESHPDHSASTWVNPNTQNHYTVTPTRTYNSTVDDTTVPCRTYTMQAIIDGKSQFVTGRACRVNGQWVAQS